MSDQIVAFSGGKDSTAMVLRMHELGEKFCCLFTRTGNELPEVYEHIHNVIARTGADIVYPDAPDLDFLIRQLRMIPNHRARWCTRMIKIRPCIEYLKAHPGSTLCIGLRADEEGRSGLEGSHCEYRYPLKEWGWGLEDVVDYCEAMGANVPRRTDCALCFDQRLIEWWHLWKEQPQMWTRGEQYEEMIGHTFRSDARDTWPASLKGLRERFEAGDKPTRSKLPTEGRCRVCTM